MNKTLCQKWIHSEKNINPVTHRRIQPSGKISNLIDKQCVKFLHKKPKDYVEVGDYIFKKEKVRGDGTCLFHSISFLYFDNFNKTRNHGLGLRHIIAESLTLSKYIKIGNGIIAKMRMFEATDLEVSELDFNTLNILQIISKNANYIQLKKLLKIQFRKFKDDFLSTETYADEYMLDYTSEYLKLNIIVVGDNGTITAGRKFVKRFPTIFVYNYVGIHYEPLVGLDGKTVFNWSDTKDILKNSNFILFK